jgi:hypothetical protein
MASIIERERLKHELLQLYRQQCTEEKTLLVPTPGISMYLPCCIGGRAEVRTVGMQGLCTYVDLKSAFVSAALMIPDHDFRNTFVTTGIACDFRMRAMLSGGPFQVAGLEVSWLFKPGVEPTFPMRVEGRKYNGQVSETLIFPASGSGHITWPEFYAAYTDGLLEKFIVHSIIEFQPLETSYLSQRIRSLLIMRHDDDYGVIKGILTHFYGKTLQGLADVRENPTDVSGMSSISCIALGSFMNGVTRGITGQIIQRNRWIGIASDAVIIAGNQPVQTGPMAQAIQRVMDPLGYTFVGTDFLADQALFLKARGYLMSGQKVKNGVPSGKRVLKMANMGMKTDRQPDQFDPDKLGHQQVDDFMTGLISGRLRCYNFQSFSHLEREYAENKKQREDLQRQLRNSRNMQSRLRQAAGISAEKLEVEHCKRRIEIPFRDYETERVSAFIASGSKAAEALAKVMSEYQDLRSQYEEAASYEIYPRKYFYTVSVNHSYDMKRVPMLDTLRRERSEFTYGPSDGSSPTAYSFDHVAFDTRPLYSADEYKQLIQAAGYRMDYGGYVSMLDDLYRSGVLSDYHVGSYQTRGATYIDEGQRVLPCGITLVEQPHSGEIA